MLDPAEDARLAALAEYCVLDTADEDEYDDITRLAAEVCRTPISLVSLIDRHRQWFKSRIGLAATETPREVSFCTHAVAKKATLVVADATADPRFAENPFVTGQPNIRFYAGAPLISPDGSALGTVCVIDRRPRAIEPSQVAALQALSRQVVRLLEMRRVSMRLADALAETDRLRDRPAVCRGCRRLRNPAGHWLDSARFDGPTEQCPACKDTDLRARLRG